MNIHIRDSVSGTEVIFPHGFLVALSKGQITLDNFSNCESKRVQRALALLVLKLNTAQN
jgi:hypothetical protein